MTIEEEIRAALLAEYEAIPPIEELEKMHTFSERHEKQMMELFAEVERRDKRRKICFDRTIDYKDEKIGTYFLDLITGKVTNITEEKDKYGIVGYDGYYDVFVARDEDFNWTLWSKEKVLGEAKE